MPDWERLGKYVVSRRIELGYNSRQPFAEALGVSPRTLGDLETGRRDKYIAGTIARLENVLGWETGSVQLVVDGGEPIMRRGGTPPAKDATTSSRMSERDEALAKVMRSPDITDEQKRHIVELLIAERVAFDRQIAERAEQMIRLARGPE